MGGSGPNGRLLAENGRLWSKKVVMVETGGRWPKTGDCGRRQVVVVENGWWWSKTGGGGRKTGGSGRKQLVMVEKQVV